MNKQDFISFTLHPEQLGQQEVNELSTFLNDYPYCTSAQILYTKALHNIGDVGYDRQLKRAASYAPNRQVLYQFLMQQKLIDVIEQVERTAEPTASPKLTLSTKEKALPIQEKQTQEEATNDTEIKPDVTALEQEILREAISASISLDVDEISKEETIESEAKSAPEEIKIDIKNGRLSFTQWLNPTGGEAAKSRRETFDDIIDQFIQTTPRISPEKSEIFSPSNMAKMSLVEDEEFVTETLANIYVKQGNYEKARKAFEHLRLKNPEKSAYFARLLKDLDGLEG